MFLANFSDFLKLPQSGAPTITSDPITLMVDAVIIVILVWIMIQRARAKTVGGLGIAFTLALFGFIGSWLVVFDRIFYDSVNPTHVALWSLKDIGILIGLISYVTARRAK